jgi:hypothetical protein
MFHRFQYESEFYPELNRLPLHVRMKLDIAGIKLSLTHWLAFSLEERRVICHLPVESEEELQAFVGYMNFLCQRYNGSAAQRLPPMSPTLWNSELQIPQPVVEKSRDSGRTITLEEWMDWQSHERYALYKTAVSTSEPENFCAVLTELRQRRAAI